ncbi:MAG: C-terminal binding protein [Bacillota bacterium]|nr:C-terminal binding protein [Bacillota bacterium]
MKRFKVVVTDYEYETLRWEKEQLDVVDAELIPCQCKTEDELIASACEADALLVQYACVTRLVIESLQRCKVIVRYGIGVDSIDLEAAAEYGIPVVNVPDYGLEEVADHTMALLMACGRKLLNMDQTVKQGTWNYKLTKPLYRFKGKKLGLIAFGNIARLVAKRAMAFGIEVQVFDPYLSEQMAREYGVEMVDFSTLIKSSDYISVHCPANASTHHMFNREVFQKMKPTAVFINTARGVLVDQEALAEALQNQLIAAAGIDVSEQEPLTADNRLLTLDNIIITPHAAWYTEESQQNLQTKAGEEVARVISGKDPIHVVNPEYRKG